MGRHAPAVDRSDRLGVCVVCRGIGHCSVLQRVVEQDDAAAPHELQASLVVAVIACLVGIDERKVERAGGPVADERGQRIASRAKSKVDAATERTTGLRFCTGRARVTVTQSTASSTCRVSIPQSAK